MRLRKLIVWVISLAFIAQIFFCVPINAQEDAADEGEDDTDQTSTVISTKRYEGKEGEFIDYNSTVRVFSVRYFNKQNPDVYNDVTYFYDENTKVEYEKDIDVEDLRSRDKIEVYVREVEGKTQHFNITRSEEHMADRIVVVEKRK